MKTCIVAIVVSTSVLAAHAQDRIKLDDNAHSTSVKDAIKTVVNAFDSEDIDAYVSCFKESKRKRMRRLAAFAFVDDKCSMELLDSHVIESTPEATYAAVKYRMSDLDESYEVVSEVKFVKEGGRWVVDSESVKSKIRGRSQGGYESAAPGKNQGWDDFNPDSDQVSPFAQHLIGDIGVQSGMGCAGGRCLNGRCEK